MVYVLLAPGFEEAEALVPVDMLRRGGVDVALVGLDSPTVTGSHGICVAAERQISQVALETGDMLLLPGGPGVEALERHGQACALIRQAARQTGVWLAAICAAPALLGRMGLLAGRRAVCYPGMEADLSRHGAIPQMEQAAVVDGEFVTGRGPGAAFDFAFKVLEVLCGGQTADQVRLATHYRG